MVDKKTAEREEAADRSKGLQKTGDLEVRFFKVQIEELLENSTPMKALLEGIKLLVAKVLEVTGREAESNYEVVYQDIQKALKNGFTSRMHQLVDAIESGDEKALEELQKLTLVFGSIFPANDEK